MIRQKDIWLFGISGLLLIASTLALLAGPQTPYLFHNALPPMSYCNGHGYFFLGTTDFGTDMLQAVLYGSGASLWLGLSTVFVIGIFGVGVGALMGISQRRMQHIGPLTLLLLLLGIILGYFYGFAIRKYTIIDAADSGLFGGIVQMVVGLLIFCLFTLSLLSLGRRLDQKIGWNWSVSRGEGMLWLLQVLDSLPTLLLIIALMAVFKQQSLLPVMALIALTSWSQLALLTRGHVVKENQLPYVEAARMLGMSDLRIFWRHLLPNILPSVAVVLALAVGRIILAESALGFLGLIKDHEGLGYLISRARVKISYPWLGIFPGGMLALIMVLLHQIGERFKLFE